MSDWAAWVWLNGRLVRRSEAAVSVFDRSFLLGDGLFETMRAGGGRVFRTGRHLARLSQGAALIRLSLPWGLDELAEATASALEANELEEAAIRLTVSRGVGPPGPALDGVGPATGVIAVRPFTGYPEHWYRPGATAVISRVVKNERSPLCGVKSTSFLDHVWARAEAAEQGADEALLLNSQSDLCEGSTTNLFVVIADVLHTPDLESGCLPGVTREAVLQLAGDAGRRVREGPLPLGTIPDWEEAFLTNSLMGIAPLARIDGRLLNGGQPGPITEAMMARYGELVASERSA